MTGEMEMLRGYPGRVEKKAAPVKKTKRKPTGAAAMGAGPGRPKGVPNKMTAELKEAILEAASTAHSGGLVAYLRLQAMQDNPSPFMTLLGRVLPLTLAGDKDAPLKVETVPSDEAIASAVAEIWRRNPAAKPKD